MTCRGDHDQESCDSHVEEDDFVVDELLSIVTSCSEKASFILGFG